MTCAAFAQVNVIKAVIAELLTLATAMVALALLAFITAGL
jgi:hypothetical protein